MNLNNILFNREGNIGIVSINRTESLNALNTQVLDELEQAIDETKSDEDIHILIITGEGRAFAAGADISEMKDMDTF